MSITKKIPIRHKQLFLGGLLIVLIVLALYLPTLHFDFVNWDDDVLILNNKYIQSVSTNNIYHILFDFSYHIRMELGKEYLPLRDLLSMFDWWLWGNNPFGFHLTNLLLYLAICLLLYAFFYKHNITPTVAVLATLLFAVHPAHVESVAWVTARKNLLSTFFLLLSLHFYFMATAKKKISVWAAAISLILFVAAVLSKHWAVVLPLLLIIYEICLKNTGLTQLWRGKRWLFMIFGLLASLLFLLQLAVGKRVGIIVGRPVDNLLEIILLPPLLLLRYLQQLLLPLQRGVFFYLLLPSQSTILEIVLALLAVIFLLFIFFTCRRKHGWLALAIAWFIITLLPFIQIVPILNLMTWRYLFPASFAISFLLVAIERKIEKKHWRQGFVLTTLFVITVFCWQTVQMIPVWQNGHIFWNDVLKHNNKNEAAWQNLTYYYVSQNQPKKALKLSRRFVHNWPNNANARYLMGLHLFENGKTEEAQQQIKKAILIKPDFLQAINDLGFMQLSVGNLSAAEKSFRRTISLAPDYSKGLNNLGQVYYQQKKLGQAKSFFLQAIQYDPYNIKAAYNLAVVEVMSGQRQKAKKIISQILKLDPQNKKVLKLLADITTFK